MPTADMLSLVHGTEVQQLGRQQSVILCVRGVGVDRARLGQRELRLSTPVTDKEVFGRADDPPEFEVCDELAAFKIPQELPVIRGEDLDEVVLEVRPPQRWQEQVVGGLTLRAEIAVHGKALLRLESDVLRGAADQG
jgi:hypothetical protein